MFFYLNMTYLNLHLFTLDADGDTDSHSGPASPPLGRL